VTKRDEQRQETRGRIVEAAVRSLVETGYAATTALGVQHRAEVSRGALLHHFPTSEALSSAAVQRLVEINLDAVRAEARRTPQDADPIARGVGVLYRASRADSFGAELELWAASRADQQLHDALLSAERSALKQLRDVILDLFGPDIAERPGYRNLVTLTVQFLRGLTISRALGTGDDHDTLVATWTEVMRVALASPANPLS
jgi:AcrR family transcriptional regulator